MYYKLVQTLILIIFTHFSIAQEYKIELKTKRNEDRSVDFFYTKQMVGTYHLIVTLSNLDNTFSSGFNRGVKNKTGKLFTMKPSVPNKSIRFNYSYQYARGKLNPKFDEKFNYLFPLSEGGSTEVRTLSNFHTSYRGKKNPKNWNAYQFSCNALDTVYAARKGLVVEIVNLYQSDTTMGYSMRSNVNKIIIEHKDGTLARYSGIKKMGFLVKVGDKVLPRKALGIVGKYDINSSELRFMVYYLTKLDPNDKTENRQEYGYVKPYFYTSEGGRTLIDNEQFITQVSHNLIEIEMTKKEKKKYKK